MKTQSTMHVFVMLFLFCFSCVRAFVPCMPGLARDLIIMSRTSELARVTTGLNRYVSKRGALAAEKEDGGEEDQEPMDLDLEQMFEVFEAADKEISDEAVGKKGEKKPAAGKDVGDAMGDMLSNLFGGGGKK